MNLHDFYYKKVQPLHDFYFRMEQRGIRVDFGARRELVRKYKRLDHENDLELSSLVGHDINVNSPKQVGFVLYEELKIPYRKDTGEETLKSLLLNVLNKKPDKAKIVELILKGRKIKKTISTYIMAKVDSDGRIRTLCNIVGTETGRTSTSKLKPPTRAEIAGLPFQTLTKHGEVGPDLRGMFIPDVGYEFVEPDLSQAESRVVAILARDTIALAAFDEGRDIHKLTASWLYGCLPDTVTENQRDLGKAVRHAGERGMGKHRLMMLAAGHDLKLSEWYSGELLKKFHDSSPNIKSVYFHDVEEALLRNGLTLVSPQGRKRTFFERWGEELLKEAYSQLPQATVGDHLKFSLVEIERQAPYIQMLQEGHDSGLTQVPSNQIDEAAQIMTEILQQPIDFSECSLPRGILKIPCEIKVGKQNWMKMEKRVLDKRTDRRNASIGVT